MTELSSRDLELLSAYLDGQLSQADGARLESRIKNNPELRSVYDGLRQTRALLRKLPARRAPRNFRLTPQMVGIKPSIPRSFPIFRLTSVLASILLFLGYAVNLFSPAISMGAATSFFPYDTYSANAPAPTEAPNEAFQPKIMAEEPTEAPPSTQQDAVSTATVEGTLEPSLYATNAIATLDPAASTLMVVPESAINANAEVTPRDNARTMQPGSRAATVPIHPFWLLGLLSLAVVSGAGALIVRKRAEPPSREKLTTREIMLIVLGLLIAALLAAGIYWLFLS